MNHASIYSRVLRAALAGATWSTLTQMVSEHVQHTPEAELDARITDEGTLEFRVEGLAGCNVVVYQLRAADYTPRAGGDLVFSSAEVIESRDRAAASDGAI